MREGVGGPTRAVFVHESEAPSVCGFAFDALGTHHNFSPIFADPRMHRMNMRSLRDPGGVIVDLSMQRGYLSQKGKLWLIEGWESWRVPRCGVIQTGSCRSASTGTAAEHMLGRELRRAVEIAVGWRLSTVGPSCEREDARSGKMSARHPGSAAWVGTDHPMDDCSRPNVRASAGRLATQLAQDSVLMHAHYESNR